MDAVANQSHDSARTINHSPHAVTSSTPNDWIETAQQCGTDKVRYMHYYWNHLRVLQNRRSNFLEIGVFRGESLKMWKQLLPHANINALDINPECTQYSDPPRVEVTIGSQADTKDLDKWTGKVNGAIDVIVDDGSHVMEHLITSFRNLFPKLTPGGVYVLEDLGTSYWPDYGGGLHKRGTIIEFLKSLVDDVNTECSNVGNPFDIAHMHFYDNICFVYKKLS